MLSLSSNLLRDFDVNINNIVNKYFFIIFAILSYAWFLQIKIKF